MRSLVRWCRRVLLAVAAVLVLPSFIDWNNYRDDIAAQIESATGRRVLIDGDVSN